MRIILLLIQGSLPTSMLILQVQNYCVTLVPAMNGSTEALGGAAGAPAPAAA